MRTITEIPAAAGITATAVLLSIEGALELPNVADALSRGCALEYIASESSKLNIILLTGL